MFFITGFNQSKMDFFIQKGKENECGCNGCECEPEKVVTTDNFVMVGIGKSAGKKKPKKAAKETPLIKTVGYFNTAADAVDAVESNIADLRNDRYTYVVIENIEEGVHEPAHDNYVLYKWSDLFNKYLGAEKSLHNDLMNYCIPRNSDIRVHISTIG